MFFKRKKTQSKKAVERKIALTKVYTDKFKNDWFEYTNPLSMPVKRTISAEVATRFAELNLTKNELQHLIGEMKKRANDGNIVELFAILNEVEFRMNYIGEEKTLIELALCYFVLGDEDETQFTDEAQERKRDILKNDSEARDFFLQKGFERTIQYSNLSENDILDYLKKVSKDGEKLESYLRTLKSENILMK